MRILAVIALIAFAPAVSLAQSAGEVERCFQNPGSLRPGRGRRRRDRRPGSRQLAAVAWWPGDDAAGGAGA